ncbi:MAG: hypothetical protein WC553_01045 [Patescibacteria group bacterium]|jgi:CheY-like chemotaxis protein
MSGTRLNKAMVLVVDDSRGILVTARKRLEKLQRGGIIGRCDLCDDGSILLGLYREAVTTGWRTVIAICDYDMPQLTGIQVIQQLQQIAVEHGWVPPVVCIATNGDIEKVVSEWTMAMPDMTPRVFPKDDFVLGDIRVFLEKLLGAS